MPRIASACFSGLVAIVRDLDPAGLAPLADPHLGLDHARIADLVGGLDRSRDGVGVPARRDRDAVLGEQLLALVLEQVHQSAEVRRSAIPSAGAYPSLAGGGNVALAIISRPASHTVAPGTAAITMPLPKLKDIKWVTTDCYGTLIDWEKGIVDAFTQGG